MTVVTADDFRSELEAQIGRARRQGRPHAEINAGELHRMVGGYPPSKGSTHRMPVCCSVMRAVMTDMDMIVHETPSGESPSFTVRYVLSQ